MGRAGVVHGYVGNEGGRDGFPEVSGVGGAGLERRWVWRGSESCHSVLAEESLNGGEWRGQRSRDRKGL